MERRSWVPVRRSHAFGVGIVKAEVLVRRMAALLMLSQAQMGLTPSVFILGTDAWRWRIAGSRKEFGGVPVDLHGAGGLRLICSDARGGSVELECGE